jgi:hypothetical protein
LYLNGKTLSEMAGFFDYVREGGLFNLGDTIEMYNLEKLTPLLKGLLIK